MNFMPEDKELNKTKARPVFNESLLSEEDLENFKFVKTRIDQLKLTRQNVFGVNLEEIWQDADKNCIPHRVKGKGNKTLVEYDETTGWRGTSHFVDLKSANWQSDFAHSNPFVKLQTALAILIDRNPEGVFLPGSSKYEAINELVKQLYHRNWEMTKSKQQLKLFVFNLIKYGWACARTFPLQIKKKTKFITEYNEEKPEDSIYSEKEVYEFNDVYRENLDPWNTWIDDLARPNDVFSVRDWCWRKVYAMDRAEEEFGKYANWKYVQEGGITTDKIKGLGTSKKFQETKLIEVYFYENRIKDLWMVIANNIPVLIEPLPISDINGAKKLSLWQTYWLLRHAECPYGVGLYEAIRYDQTLLDRIRNMTIDQLTLSIYKMGFYQGTQTLSDTGIIHIKPGVLKQVLNPKDITWFEIPGPGKEAWKGIEIFQNDVNVSSGVSETLMGEVTGKTAFEIAQAKEAALNRLKSPLDNICEALETDAYLTLDLIQMLYSIPETIKIADPSKIDAYLNAVNSDPALFEYDKEGNFIAKIYREVQLGLDTNEKGQLVTSGETRFFRIKPEGLKWEGIINIKAQSILRPSKELTKAMDLEFANLLIPLLAQPPEIVLKPTKQLCKIYDKDPKDWLPDSWFQTESPSQNISPMTNLPLQNIPSVKLQPTQGTQGGRLVNNLMNKIGGFLKR